MLICRIDAWILVILGVLGSSIKGLIFLMDLNTLFFIFILGCALFTATGG